MLTTALAKKQNEAKALEAEKEKAMKIEQ